MCFLQRLFRQILTWELYSLELCNIVVEFECLISPDLRHFFRIKFSLNLFITNSSYESIFWVVGCFYFASFYHFILKLLTILSNLFSICNLQTNATFKLYSVFACCYKLKSHLSTSLNIVILFFLPFMLFKFLVLIVECPMGLKT